MISRNAVGAVEQLMRFQVLNGLEISLLAENARPRMDKLYQMEWLHRAATYC